MTVLFSHNFDNQGKLPDYVRIMVDKTLADTKGKRLTLAVKRAKKYSTDSQRKYYFAVIVTAWQDILRRATDRFWDKDETHDFLMSEIGQWLEEVPLKKGKKLRRRSYTDLSTIETEEHHTKCRMAAAIEGVDIPEPGESND